MESIGQQSGAPGVTGEQHFTHQMAKQILQKHLLASREVEGVDCPLQQARDLKVDTCMGDACDERGYSVPGHIEDASAAFNQRTCHYALVRTLLRVVNGRQ